ncbi:MAG: NAD-dependent epimerase/dehydratase family protein [Candidatus Dormibacteria bacterium]
MALPGGSGATPSLVLVTGGSGFVGGAVVRALLARGYSVRLLLRRQAAVDPCPGVERVAGDITDRASLERAMRGCAAAIHCAADYRLALRPAEVDRMIVVNVGGTLNVLEAARVTGVSRVVHCSTVGTLHFDRSGRVCAEADRAPSSASLAGPYKRSKWAAERLALNFTGGAPDVVVVQPSTPVGRGDSRPTPTGATIRDFLAGRIPAVIQTGLNLVDVEAVGRGHVLALERGQPGLSYILGDRNLTLSQLLGEVASQAGRQPPAWRIPLLAGYGAAVTSEAVGRWRRRPPAIPLTSVRMAAHPMYVDSARARQELGWSPGDLGRALREAVAELTPVRSR